MKIKNPIIELSNAYGRFTYKCGKLLLTGIVKAVKPISKALKHVTVGYFKVAKLILNR